MATSHSHLLICICQEEKVVKSVDAGLKPHTCRTHTHAEERLVWQEKLENVSSTKFPLDTHTEKTLKSEYEINKKRLLFTDCCPLPNRLVLWPFGNESICKSCGAASLGPLCRLKQNSVCERVCVCVLYIRYVLVLDSISLSSCDLTSLVFSESAYCWASLSSLLNLYLFFLNPDLLFRLSVHRDAYSCLCMLTVKYNTLGDFLDVIL